MVSRALVIQKVGGRCSREHGPGRHSKWLILKRSFSFRWGRGQSGKLESAIISREAPPTLLAANSTAVGLTGLG